MELEKKLALFIDILNDEFHRGNCDLGSFKYIDKFNKYSNTGNFYTHYERIKKHASFLNPPVASSVLDIGAGCGFLLYTLKSKNRCDVTALDMPNHLYDRSKQLLDIKTIYQKIIKFEPINYDKKYDYITITRSSFDFEANWEKDEYVYFLQDCCEHGLKENGMLYWDIKEDCFLSRTDRNTIPIDKDFFLTIDANCVDRSEKLKAEYGGCLIFVNRSQILNFLSNGLTPALVGVGQWTGRNGRYTKLAAAASRIGDRGRRWYHRDVRRRFFASHGMRRHLRRLSSALRRSSAPDYEWSSAAVIRSRVQPTEMGDAFHAVGYPRRHFFPHAIHVLPKIAPDGFKLSSWMCASEDIRQLWQVALFALDPVRSKFPANLYADTEVNWHLQQFGRSGHVATACIRITANSMYVLNMHSDLVQRMSRRRDYKTGVEARLSGWPRLLVHALAAYALAAGLKRLYVASSALAMEHTDKSRRVQPEMFERVYDRAVQHHFNVQRDGRWWRIELESHRGVIIPFASCEEPVMRGRTICVTHDLERGHGHRDVDPDFARRADAMSPAALTGMLAIERKLGVRATYNVVGCMLNEVRAAIESDAHCIGFHSFDHNLRQDQLGACRQVDYRIKGYRPPRSRITGELRDERLAWHDVEWLASGPHSLGVSVPTLVNRVVRIPVLFDDFDLDRGLKTFDAWAREALETIQKREFVAFGLHDCYAAHWLPHYERFLEEVKRLGTLRTLDETAADVFLSAGV